ncbi:hypothetical protein FJ417_05040 [Mesorhizobium sp. B3-1-7]|uniref:hypothetical protein n=1 Tax=Mesorhizobium sp. B3-1-7 TaxID=2589894 RepID=UPI00112966D1|nr:hypothetical protein FJ417_05040 [Mesorhizobium sp. B3-1-7]
MAGWQRAKYWLRNASGTNFTLDGKPFFVTGVNNHYLTYGSQDEVTRVLASVVLCADHTRSFGRFERRRRGGAPPDHRPVYRRVWEHIWEHIGSSSRENS